MKDEKEISRREFLKRIGRFTLSGLLGFLFLSVLSKNKNIEKCRNKNLSYDCENCTLKSTCDIKK